MPNVVRAAAKPDSTCRIVFIAIAMLSESPLFAQICDGNVVVEGVNAAITDDGQGNVYVLGGTGGLYRSCNDGDTWTGDQVDRDQGYSLLVDPLDNSIVYYGTNAQGIYRSSDYGETFALTGIGVITDRVGALAAIDGGAILAGTPSGVYISNDQGITWSRMDGSPYGAPIDALLTDPANRSIIFSGTNGDGLYRTDNDGFTWVRTGGFDSVNDLDYLPGSSSVIFASAEDGLWQSADAGTVWSSLGGLEILDLAIDPANPSRIYRVSRVDGVSKSVDGGQTWVLTNSDLPGPLTDMLSVHVLPGGRVLLGRELGGLFLSDDAGASWVPADPSYEPPAPIPQPQAQLAIELRFLGQNGAVEAGTKASFYITVKNLGPDASLNTRLYVSWGRGSRPDEGIGLVPAQGSCTPSANDADCWLGTIDSGDSVLVGFEGSTVHDWLRVFTYTLHVVAANDRQRDSALEIATVRTFNAPVGGGGGGSFGLIWSFVLFCLIAPCQTAIRRVARTTRLPGNGIAARPEARR